MTICVLGLDQEFPSLASRETVIVCLVDHYPLAAAYRIARGVSHLLRAPEFAIEGSEGRSICPSTSLKIRYVSALNDAAR